MEEFIKFQANIMKRLANMKGELEEHRSHSGVHGRKKKYRIMVDKVESIKEETKF